MDMSIDTEDLHGKFERNWSHYVNNVMVSHFPYNVKKSRKIKEGGEAPSS